MSDIKNSVLPDIIEPMSNAIHQNIPELYLLLLDFLIMLFCIL